MFDQNVHLGIGPSRTWTDRANHAETWLCQGWRHTRYGKAHWKSLLESYDCLQESRLRTDADLTFAITQSFVSQTEDTSVAQGPGVAEYKLMISSCDQSPVRSGSRLRSYRTMKHRPIRDYTVNQETRRACTAF
ncbi:hypothetical protein DAEQUDRAFT_461539 [Daedalea quercina L-15889]|uniref:Uncharacterized protein n=1 Tax=Daedalea quercina L-15889 TaxID=1314783 RepID=A0A165TD19_9APHY|nr:hypothetical protein DAEQUDRAFT_461539 [Daedalea quercina L-15889]